MTTAVFDCRATKQGAFTAIIWISVGVDFTSFDVSKSRKHWKEKVEGPVGAEFVLQDITNSGKHRCARYRFTEGGVETVEAEGDICPCDLSFEQATAEGGSKLVNPVTVIASDLAHGDVMAVVVTLHVVERGDGLVFRVYRCGYPPQEHEGIPQGHRVLHEKRVAEDLFPVVLWAGMKPDLL